MKLQTLSSQHQKLCDLIAEANKFEADQIELRAHWAKYLCILSSGFLENALTEVYSSYARSCSNSDVSNFVHMALERIHNPKAGRFSQTARSFDKAWGQSLDEFLKSDGNGDAIDAIMTNRHRIAHGEDSDITLVRLKDYLARSVKVIEFIEEQCFNNNNG